MKSIYIFLFFFCSSLVLDAQVKYHTKSKKAIEFFDAATYALREHKKTEAIGLLDKALAKDPLFLEALAVRGDVYGELKQFDKAIADKETALKIDPDNFSFLYLDLGGLYFNIQNYDKAEGVLKTYLEKEKSNSRPFPESIKKAEKLLSSCAFAKEAVKNPVPFNPVNMGSNVNSTLKDYNPFVTLDGQTFYLTRTIWTDSVRDPLGNMIKDGQEDLFVSFKDNNAWTPANNVGGPINSEVMEGAISLSPNGNVMILTVCEKTGNWGKGRTGFGSCDLFYTQKLNNGKWSVLKNLGPEVNSGKFDAQPSVSTDGKDVYFASSRAGGYGSSDIYVTHFTEKGWSKPENLGANINTYGFEDGVFIHPDNQTLYFASSGLPGMGGRDIYMSKKQADGSWGIPRNLGYPINTADDERSMFIDAKGEVAYFASDRAGGVGDLDIYQFKMPPALRPIPVTYMKGFVFDAQTKTPMVANFELIDLASGKKVYSSTSEAKDGSFLVALPTQKNYALNVQAADGNYTFFSENFELTIPAKGELVYKKDVPMKKVAPGVTNVLKNVFFDTDSYLLKNESKVELDKLAEFLNNNPTLKIELGGHTDNQGSKEHNLLLSKNRASEVKKYLIKQGIDAERLSIKGYADEVPVDSNSTEEGRANNRRMEWKVL